MPSRFVPSFVLPSGYDGEIVWFAFRGHDLVVRDPKDSAFVEIPVARKLADAGLEPIRTQVLGQLEGRPVCSAEIDENAQLPPGFVAYSLRRLFGRLDLDLFDVAGTAYQVQLWDKMHQVCTQCATALEVRPGTRCKHCAKCNLDYFPKISPCIIVLVEDGDTVLLGRHPRLPQGMYALIAGFLEPGETLENCVAREVWEETGIDVDDIRYFGSQPWPFPHQLMMGFFARKRGGELRVDKEELEDAKFFHVDQLPLLPPPISIARKLIDTWIARKKA
ncbi:MAG TPA: NAD(+) diphosphatase [Polyangium sp.]|nr:NAD(+) diphosphatase [Polyangium sp.]